MVSQNADEVYLTFGKEDPGYHEYLDSGNVARGQDPFLRMQSYGPWRIRNPAHMRQLGIAILLLPCWPVVPVVPVVILVSVVLEGMKGMKDVRPRFVCVRRGNSVRWIDNCFSLLTR